MPRRTDFKSILWQTLRIRVGSLKIRGVALHRHLPETTQLGLHRHGYHQILVYLAGHGIQQINKTSHPAGAGTLVLLPATTPHAFRRLRARAPSCLVLEFESPNIRAGRPIVRQLSALELGRLRFLLSRLAKLQESADPSSDLGRASLVIELMQMLLSAVQTRPSAPPASISPMAHRVRALLQSDASDSLTIAEIARRIGYQPDYLGRAIKAETGLTLGQWRARERVNRAKAALQSAQTVGDAGAAVGFLDQNYFARWFRDQTGFTPSAWKLHRGASR